MRKRRNIPIESRFWDKVTKTDTCWLWTRAISNNGYGVIGGLPGETKYAHRIAYQMVKGSIPEGLELDHLCRNRACVNPNHLEPVTTKENVHRGFSPAGIQSRLIVCQKGHPLDRQNTYVSPQGRRMCRACSYMRSMKEHPTHRGPYGARNNKWKKQEAGK